MTALPIVDRELRVAARKPSSFWIRVAAAVTGVVVGSGCLLIGSTQGVRTSELGSMLFYALTWMCLAAALGAGLFFTSDCLSEEKREGTLGLLFLTELRGYDVALGKLLATSLRSFYALLAVLPVLAITQLMGGVAGAQYWKSALALVNALLFSLTTGLLVSALSRDSQKAIAGTLLVLLLVTLGGPVADAVIAGIRHRGFAPAWSLASPGYVLVVASAWGPSAYWPALGITQALAWLMLVLASALVPRAWQDAPRRSVRCGWSYALRYGSVAQRERLRRRLLGHDPMAWLASRERWQSRGLWALALLIVSGFSLLLTRTFPKEAWIVWNYVGGLFTLLLYFLAASQACRFFVEARRRGLLELLLVSPVTERQILSGQWRGLRRLFGWPLLLLLGVHVTASALSQLSFQRMMAQTSASVSSAMTNQVAVSTNQSFGASTTVIVTATGTNYGTAAGGFSAGKNAGVGLAILAVAAKALSTVGNLLALAWFGMWMGMTSRSANLATLKTILFVQIIPWLVIAFGTTVGLGMLMAGLFLRNAAAAPAAWLVWWPLLSAILGAGLALGKDIGFILWARKRLYSSLRHQALGNLERSQFVPVTPPTRPSAVPPVIVAPS